MLKMNFDRYFGCGIRKAYVLLRVNFNYVLIELESWEIEMPEGSYGT